MTIICSVQEWDKTRTDPKACYTKVTIIGQGDKTKKRKITTFKN